MRIAFALSLIACTNAAHTGDDVANPDVVTATCDANISIATLTAPNTSASPTYDRDHFPANFGTQTWIAQSGTTLAVDPAHSDLSLNAVTPGRVSNVDVHTLIPSRPDLRWFAHSVPWFGTASHISIGVDSTTTEYLTAMIADMKRRGFDGVIVDWYGQGSREDQATLKIRDLLRDDPSFKLIVMLDKGIASLSQSVLEQQLAYVAQHYFGEASYEREGGKPIVMFFGVEAALGSTVMAAVKASAGANQVWVEQGAAALGRAYIDEAFDWTHDFHAGPSTSDPYNLAAVRAYYQAVASSPKRAFGSMVSGFNGMLTNSVAWSKGKYLPQGHGACIVEWAKTIDHVIPANVTRMQWATWSDWEEGTAIEPGIENDVAVSAMRDGDTLTWTLSGDESTVDHYEVYGSPDGAKATLLGTTRDHAFPISGCDSYVVIAVGKPQIRDHASAWVH